MTQQTEHAYVVTDDELFSGEPIIKGTRTPVRSVAESWRLGMSPEEILLAMPHLSLAQVFDSLSYYSDHQDEINGYIEDNRILPDLLDPRFKDLE